MSPSHFLPPLFIPFGLLFAVVGVRGFRTSRYLRRNGHRVPGVVHQLVYHHSDSGGTYHPLLHFHTLDGKFVATTCDVGTRPARSRPGDRVTVVYDPARPDHALPENLMGTSVAMDVLFVVVGMVTTAVATIITVNLYG